MLWKCYRVQQEVCNSGTGKDSCLERNCEGLVGDGSRLHQCQFSPPYSVRRGDLPTVSCALYKTTRTWKFCVHICLKRSVNHNRSGFEAGNSPGRRALCLTCKRLETPARASIETTLSSYSATSIHLRVHTVDIDSAYCCVALAIHLPIRYIA
jgi:hypothetical protein